MLIINVITITAVLLYSNQPSVMEAWKVHRDYSEKFWHSYVKVQRMIYQHRSAANVTTVRFILFKIE